MSERMEIDVQMDVAEGTFLSSIVVPDHLRIKHRTRLSWFDDALGGLGFTPSTVTLYTGDPGAGKTTSVLQLAEAISQNPDAAVLYNTGEESLYQVKMTSERLKLKGNFEVADHIMTGSVFKHAISQRARTKCSQQYIICDSLQTLDDGFYSNGSTNGQTPIRVIQQFASFAKSMKFGNPCIICIGHVNKDGKFEGRQKLKHAIDVHLHLVIDVDPKSTTFGLRQLETQKNRYGCAGRSQLLEMTTNGLIPSLIQI